MGTEGRGSIVLPTLAPEVATALLCPPCLPASAASDVPLVRRAAAGAVPVLLTVPARGGRLRLARALHTVGERSGPLIAATGRRPVLWAMPAGSTLYVDVAALAPEAMLAVEALLDDGEVWIVVGSEPGATVPETLATRLAVVLTVPPLHERIAEVPALAAHLLTTLAARHRTPVPQLGASALAQLGTHPWPGDLMELEAVIARSFLARSGDTIEAADLLLGSHGGEPAAASGGKAGTGAELEFLLAELAHELRNPMVTIKTFARHLPALLEDAELRARFETLTDEAIERIDGLLDNVIGFARLGPPRVQSIAVGPLVERVLAEMEPELTGRAVQVRQVIAPDAHCAADPEHLTYALRNLFAGVVREVPAREELVLDASVNGVVTLRFAAGGEAAERLRRLAGPGEASSLSDPTLLPLAFRLARAALDQNGGALTVIPEGTGTTTLVVSLPPAAEPAPASHA
jgi:signal transduction histidine kinase